MKTEAERIKEVEALASDWMRRNDEVLKKELRKLKVGITDELYQVIRSTMHQKASAMLQVDLNFFTYGRFRDMGAGRKAKIESSENKKELYKAKNPKGGRKPAKWYSRPFYGRLHALNGVLSAKIIEQSIQAVTGPLKIELQ